MCSQWIIQGFLATEQNEKQDQHANEMPFLRKKYGNQAKQFAEFSSLFLLGQLGEQTKLSKK